MSNAKTSAIKPTYNHAYTIAFEVPKSNCKEGSDVTSKQLKEALLKRISGLGNDEDKWKEVVGGAFDTYEEEQIA